MLGQLSEQVYECGTVLDRIQTNLDRAEDCIEEGAIALEHARKTQTSVNRMRGVTYGLILANYIMSIVMLCLKLVGRGGSSGGDADAPATE